MDYRRQPVRLVTVIHNRLQLRSMMQYLKCVRDTRKSNTFWCWTFLHCGSRTWMTKCNTPAGCCSKPVQKLVYHSTVTSPSASASKDQYFWCWLFYCGQRIWKQSVKVGRIVKAYQWCSLVTRLWLIVSISCIERHPPGPSFAGDLHYGGNDSAIICDACSWSTDMRAGERNRRKYMYKLSAKMYIYEWKYVLMVPGSSEE